MVCCSVVLSHMVVSLVFKYVESCLTVCSMSAFKLIKYTNLSWVAMFFNVHVVTVQLFQDLLLQHIRYNYSFTLHHNAIDHGEFVPYPPIFSACGSTASLESGHLPFMYLFNICSSPYSPVAAFISSINVHTGMFWLWVHLHSWLVMLDFGSPCDYIGIVNPLWTIQSQVCIGFAQHNALYLLWHCHNIFAYHSYQWFMVCDDMNFTCKTVVVKLLEPM